MDDSDLKICIQDAMKSAMRARDKPLLSTIRLVMAEIKQIEVDNPFFNWKEKIPDLLTKGCFFRFIEPEMIDFTNSGFSEEKIIENYLNKNYPAKSHTYSTLILESLKLYNSIGDREDLIINLQKNLEDTIDAEDS